MNISLGKVFTNVCELYESMYSTLFSCVILIILRMCK